MDPLQRQSAVIFELQLRDGEVVRTTSERLILVDAAEDLAGDAGVKRGERASVGCVAAGARSPGRPVRLGERQGQPSLKSLALKELDRRDGDLWKKGHGTNGLYIVFLHRGRETRPERVTRSRNPNSPGT